NLGSTFAGSMERVKLAGKVLFNDALVKVCKTFTRRFSPSKYRRFERQSRRITYYITHKECCDR
ncbi:PIPO, partial [Sweet potato virus 2]